MVFGALLLKGTQFDSIGYAIGIYAIIVGQLEAYYMNIFLEDVV